MIAASYLDLDLRPATTVMDKHQINFKKPHQYFRVSLSTVGIHNITNIVLVVQVIISTALGSSEEKEEQTGDHCQLEQISGKQNKSKYFI